MGKTRKCKGYERVWNEDFMGGFWKKVFDALPRFYSENANLHNNLETLPNFSPVCPHCRFMLKTNICLLKLIHRWSGKPSKFYKLSNTRVGLFSSGSISNHIDLVLRLVWDYCSRSLYLKYGPYSWASACFRRLRLVQPSPIFRNLDLGSWCLFSRATCSFWRQCCSSTIWGKESAFIITW